MDRKLNMTLLLSFASRRIAPQVGTGVEELGTGRARGRFRPPIRDLAGLGRPPSRGSASLHPWLHSSAPTGAKTGPPELSRTPHAVSVLSASQQPQNRGPIVSQSPSHNKPSMRTQL